MFTTEAEEEPSLGISDFSPISKILLMQVC